MKISILRFYLSFILLVITSYAFGQNETPNLPIDSVTNKITYSEVVIVDSSASKLELFSRAREWFAKRYNSSINVIQMEDKESGKIVGKALMQVYHKAVGKTYESGHIHYTISLYLKDGRYKYEITDFFHSGQVIYGGSNRVPDYGMCEKMINTSEKTMGISHQKTYDYYLTQLDQNTKSLINDLKSAMSAKPANSKKDEW